MLHHGGQWGDLRVQNAAIYVHTVLGGFFNFGFYHFHFFFFFFFWETIKFPHRILTNQKPELVITNCMDLNGLYYMDFLAVLVNVSSNYMREIGLVLAHLDMRKNATMRECLLSTSPFFISIVYCVFALEFFHSFTKMFCSCRFWGINKSITEQ